MSSQRLRSTHAKRISAGDVSFALHTTPQFLVAPLGVRPVKRRVALTS
jgi:hypothetical protein